MQILGTIGAILAVGGWIWTIIDGFQKSGVLWSIVNIIPVQPIIGIVSGALKKVSWMPVIVMIAGVAISMIGGAASVFNR